MTAQVNDLVAYEGADWTLAGVSGGELFDPTHHGLRVRAASTACWRGFVCRYRIERGALFLEDLDVAVDGEARPLFEAAPQEPKLPFGFTAGYRNIGYPFAFSGGLLLARGFLRELYVHMGFHPAWKYEHVLEVEREAGQVLKIEDRSEAMAELRSRLVGKDRPAVGSSMREIEAWVARAFSRNY